MEPALFSHCWKPSPLHTLWVGPLTPPSPSGLFVGENSPPPFSRVQGTLPSLWCVFFQLLVYYSVFFLFFFFSGQGSVCLGGYAVLFQGLAVGVQHATYLLTCVASPKQGRSQCQVAWEPSCFLCISWHGEAICRLGVWRCQSFASSWWFFLPYVSPASQQEFYFKEHTLATSSL
jgi:hypothetical protein